MLLLHSREAPDRPARHGRRGDPRNPTSHGSPVVVRQRPDSTSAGVSSGRCSRNWTIRVRS